MDVTLAVLCDYANVTREGKLNILGVFGEIKPPVLPFSLPQMFLVVAYSAGPAEFGAERTARIILTDADAHQMLALDQQLIVPQPGRAGVRAEINQILGLAGITFDRSGDYQFSILVDNDEKESVRLHVNEPQSTPLDEPDGGRT